jgi:imidazolonepropionase-like amidohydrolase
VRALIPFLMRATAATLLVVTSAGASPTAHAVPVDSATVAFVNVSVVPMDSERALTDQTVLVRDGRIVAVGRSAEVVVPAGATTIDGRGKYLIPGLAEMHAHIYGATAPQQAVDDLMFLYVANGVTTIRGMLGAPNQLVLRDRAARDEIVAPTIIVGAPSFSGQSAPTPDSARAMVRAHQRAGYDFLKLHPGLSREVYDAIVEEARAVGITFAGHVSSGVGLQRTLEARQSTIDHLDGYLEASVNPAMHRHMAAEQVPFAEMVAAVERDRLRYWAGRTREAGTWNVPTAALWETFFSPDDPSVFAARPEMRYASPEQVEAWSAQKQRMNAANIGRGVTAESAARYLELRRYALRALADSGAPLLMGTDSPQMFSVPGFSLYHEIALMQQAGLTPYQVLESGTRNVARYAREDLGAEGAFGTIEVGNRADLILLDANPLLDAQNVRNRAGVMLRGRWFPAAQLDRRLEELARRYGPEG